MAHNVEGARNRESGTENLEPGPWSLEAAASITTSMTGTA